MAMMMMTMIAVISAAALTLSQASAVDVARAQVLGEGGSSKAQPQTRNAHAYLQPLKSKRPNPPSHAPLPQVYRGMYKSRPVAVKMAVFVSIDEQVMPHAMRCSMTLPLLLLLPLPLLPLLLLLLLLLPASVVTAVRAQVLLQVAHEANLCALLKHDSIVEFLGDAPHPLPTKACALWF